MDPDVLGIGRRREGQPNAPEASLHIRPDIGMVENPELRTRHRPDTEEASAGEHRVIHTVSPRCAADLAWRQAADGFLGERLGPAITRCGHLQRQGAQPSGKALAGAGVAGQGEEGQTEEGLRPRALRHHVGQRHGAPGMDNVCKISDERDHLFRHPLVSRGPRSGHGLLPANRLRLVPFPQRLPARRPRRALPW